MKSKARQKKEKQHLKKLRQRIEDVSDAIADADYNQMYLDDLQKEHKKLTGKEWEF